jgi:Flp pilus assembly protein TadG
VEASVAERSVTGEERGAAPLEAVFGIVMLLVLVLGVLEVAFALYARNVVAASAHEGARAAIEVGRGPADAARVARSTVERAAGNLVENLEVATTVSGGPGRSLRVTVTGSLRPFGPVPIPVHVSSSATVALPPGNI